MNLNQSALRLADQLASEADRYRVAVHASTAGARIVDCGVKVAGGLEAGLVLSRVCLAGLAQVTLNPIGIPEVPCPAVTVVTDHPIAACLASQYAGWQVSVGKFFAMGSGPMRAAYGKEELFNEIPGRERPEAAVGVLESRKLPDDATIAYLAERLQLAPEKLTLLVAPTASQAGGLQIAARSVETALHKLHALKFDVNRVVSGFGSAPMPPIAKDDLTALGRTNDAILYGARVNLWVQAEDAELEELGPKAPSSASPDHGVPFGEIFERYQRDFYKIDPLLFSPAEVVLHNLTSGRSHRFGKLAVDVLRRSFFPED